MARHGHLQSGEKVNSRQTTYPAAGPAAWSPRLVADLALHPINVRLYATAPYIGEVYARLPHEAVHPADAHPRVLARPLLVRCRQRDYYIPGCADELLLHTSCAVACLPAVISSLPADADDCDYAPPRLAELVDGVFARHPLSMCYWGGLKRASQKYFNDGYSHVVFSDISRCYGSVNVERLLALLTEARADADAIRVLGQMHRCWIDAGCRGLPLTGGSRVFFKLYMRGVDERMQRAGIKFIRLNDDYRLFCRSKQEAQSVFTSFSDSLSAFGFAANKTKTHVFSSDELRRSWKPRTLYWKRLFGRGVGLPVLSEALRLAPLRPVTCRLLQRFYGDSCRTA